MFHLPAEVDARKHFLKKLLTLQAFIVHDVPKNSKEEGKGELSYKNGGAARRTF